MEAIQKQYQGCIATPALWHDSTVNNLIQFDLPSNHKTKFDSRIDSNIRLGKRVEQFIFNYLNSQSETKVLAKNLQIQNNKITLGELDCIVQQNDTITHLEVIYKFYLYDNTVGDTELDHWIGPNRKDSLIEKLNKLQHKQLPLLYKPETQLVLNTLHISTKNIMQQVCFKAQLFLPFGMSELEQANGINPQCIVGFYLHFDTLHHLKDCKFYIPTKVNWLCDIEIQVPWLTFENFKVEITPLIQNKTAPLCWVKFPNGTTKKCFVVWWH
ncbi:DUF1853 family protein [Formosa sp. A9]|uniref:DUF1853 family protein n=1 Tax=Formosa sp. A9 TaxID=3442641 RepID=UPI003EC02A9A